MQAKNIYARKRRIKEQNYFPYWRPGERIPVFTCHQQVGWFVNGPAQIRVARLAFSRPNLTNLAFFLNGWPRNFLEVNCIWPFSSLCLFNGWPFFQKVYLVESKIWPFLKQSLAFFAYKLLATLAQITYSSWPDRGGTAHTHTHTGTHTYTHTRARALASAQCLAAGSGARTQMSKSGSLQQDNFDNRNCKFTKYRHRSSDS